MEVRYNMIEEKEIRSAGKRERPASVPGRRLADAGLPQSPLTDDTIKLMPQEEMDDGLSMDTGTLPDLEDSQIFSLPEEIAAALPGLEEEEVPEDTFQLPDLSGFPFAEEVLPAEEEEEIPEEPVSQEEEEIPEEFDPQDEEEFPEELELPEEEPIPELEEVASDEVSEPVTQETEDAPSEPQPGRRVLETPSTDQAGSSKTLWSRAMDRANDLTDRVLGWTEELTDRFDYMTSDPDSDGLVARAIRGSEEILEGIEEQQRETDEEVEAEARRRDAKEQPRREKKPSPFVFVRSEELKQQASDSQPAGTAVAEPEVTPEPEPEVIQEKPVRKSKPKPEAKPKVEPKPRPKPEPKQKVERTPRPRPVRTPVPKEERKQVIHSTRSLQYWFFLIVIGFFGVVGLLSPLRAASTELEERPLTEKPALTLSGLWSGDYFARLEQWYSDTFPMRDSLAGEYDLIHGFGFGSAELEAAESNASDSQLAESSDDGTDAIPSETPDAAEVTEEPSAEDQSTEEPSAEGEGSDVESLDVPTETDEGTTTA
jgi:hypothetical protein